MSVEKRGAKRIALTQQYLELKARGILEPVDQLADRLLQARPNSADIHNYIPDFASMLRREICVALFSGGLKDFSMKLPDAKYLKDSLIKQTLKDEEGITPKVPGIALILTPAEDGWNGRFAGENHVRRVKSHINS